MQLQSAFGQPTVHVLYIWVYALKHVLIVPAEDAILRLWTDLAFSKNVC